MERLNGAGNRWQETKHPLFLVLGHFMSFTHSRTAWILRGDLGDKIALTGSGDAVLLMGTAPAESYKDGVLATCMNGQFRLQEC